MSKSKGISQDRTKVQFLRPKEKINRRELLNLFLPPALTKRLRNKLGNSSKEPITTGKAPFGKLRLDSSQCTGCGLCTLECPTKALMTSLSDETDDYQLLFRHDLCVACSRCTEVCPEQCLHLERILELDKIDSSAALLSAGEIARCRECGTVIGSRAMIGRLQVKLQAVGRSLASQLELCSACKIKQPSLGRATLELAASQGRITGFLEEG